MLQHYLNIRIVLLSLHGYFFDFFVQNSYLFKASPQLQQMKIIFGNRFYLGFDIARILKVPRCAMTDFSRGFT